MKWIVKRWMTLWSIAAPVGSRNRRPRLNMFIPIDRHDDLRIEAYRGLKDRELAASGGRFVAEGEHVVRRLLASSYRAESVLLAARKVDAMRGAVPDDVPTYVAPNEMVDGIVGFKFHSGVLAVGLRGDGASLASVLAPPEAPRLLVICPEIINSENIGSMIRISAAFGADAIVLGERCCDPFWRRSIRVSMGAAFHLPIVRSTNLMADLVAMRESFGLTLMATVLDRDAEPLERVNRPARMGVLFGSESQGLQPIWTRGCDRRITIPMQLGTDSLNVAVAAGVFLYHFTRAAPGNIAARGANP